MKKIRYFVLPLFMSLTLLAGCTPKQDAQVKVEGDKPNQETKQENDTKKPEENKEKTQEEKVDPAVLNRFDKYFYKGKDEMVYIGMAEYGYRAKYEKEVTDNPKEKTVVYKGSMSDGVGETKGPREFIASYIIDKDKVVEKIENKDYLKDRKTTLNSIIENFIVVKGEVKVGNKWEQSFKQKDKEFKAVTEIKAVEKKGDKTQFVTETTVANMEGYKDNTYIEKRTYREGLGLIDFENTPKVVNGVEPIDPMVGYGLNYIMDKDGNKDIIER